MCWDIYKQGSFQEAPLPSPTTTRMHCFINITFQGCIWKSTIICHQTFPFVKVPKRRVSMVVASTWASSTTSPHHLLLLLLLFFFPHKSFGSRSFFFSFPFFFSHKSFGSRSFFFLFLFEQNQTELGLFQPILDWIGPNKKIKNKKDLPQMHLYKLHLFQNFSSINIFLGFSFCL